MSGLRTQSGRTFALKTCAAALVVFGSLGLSACTTAPVEQPTKAPTPTEAAAQEAPPVALVLAPEKSAADNLEYFTSVAGTVVEADSNAGGRAFVDALVVGGFDRAAMQVTADTTSVDLAADSVQFSVAFNGECLVGQYGPASGGVQSMVAPLLGTGTCLVGATRQIDW